MELAACLALEAACSVPTLGQDCSPLAVGFPPPARQEGACSRRPQEMAHQEVVAHQEVEDHQEVVAHQEVEDHQEVVAHQEVEDHQEVVAHQEVEDRQEEAAD